MLVTPIKTYRIKSYEQPSLEEVLADCLPALTEKSVVAIASKVVSICEGSIVCKDFVGKDCQAIGKLKNVYILPPSDPTYTAKRVRAFLLRHFDLKKVAVLITDHQKVHASAGFRTLRNSQVAALAALALQVMINGQSTPLAVITHIAAPIFS